MSGCREVYNNAPQISGKPLHIAAAQMPQRSKNYVLTTSLVRRQRPSASSICAQSCFWLLSAASFVWVGDRLLEDGNMTNFTCAGFMVSMDPTLCSQTQDQNQFLGYLVGAKKLRGSKQVSNREEQTCKQEWRAASNTLFSTTYLHPPPKETSLVKKYPQVEEEEAEDNGMSADNVICGRTYPSRGPPTSSAL